MKKVISFLKSLMSSSKPSDGETELSLTYQSLENALSSERYDDRVLEKMLQLLDENAKLKFELEIIHDSCNRIYDL